MLINDNDGVFRQATITIVYPRSMPLRSAFPHANAEMIVSEGRWTTHLECAAEFAEAALAAAAHVLLFLWYGGR